MVEEEIEKRDWHNCTLRQESKVTQENHQLKIKLAREVHKPRKSNCSKYLINNLLAFALAPNSELSHNSFN